MAAGAVQPYRGRSVKVRTYGTHQVATKYWHSDNKYERFQKYNPNGKSIRNLNKERQLDSLKNNQTYF